MLFFRIHVNVADISGERSNNSYTLVEVFKYEQMDIVNDSSVLGLLINPTGVFFGKLIPKI